MLRRSPYKHRFMYAGVVTLLLLLSSAFVMLKTFVWVSAEEPVTPIASITFTPVPTVPNATPVQKVDTDTEYTDENIHVKITKVVKTDLVYYVADVKITSLQFLKVAFANDKFGKQHEETSSIARRYKAIFAVSGDYYGYRENGVIIRNGTLYRDKPTTAAFNKSGETLALMTNGELRIFDKSITGASMIEQGVLHSWFFGPTLVLNGAYVERESSVSVKNPRNGIGMIEPLHYVFITVDGRLENSKGLTLKEFAQLFVDYGCSVAYNLDGGGSATMFMHNKVVNSPTYGDERDISDIIYIGLE